MRKFISILIVATVLLFAVSASAADAKVVDIPLNSRAKAAECPAATGDAAAGPLQMYYSCWYLSADGGTCDKVCADVGLTNSAYDVEDEWPNHCAGVPAGSDDVATWFYNNGNAGGWTSPCISGTTYHTLGQGYRGGMFWGKCTTGESGDIGSYPGTPSTNPTRNLVCACSRL